MFVKNLIAAASAAIAILALSAPAVADESVISEVRIGIYDHNSNLTGSRHETNAPDINLEVLFHSPSWLQWMAKPRVNVGANINTSDGTSSLYSGLVWNFDITDAFFIEGGFGGAIHNGETNRETASKLNLGCRVLFHENGSLGFRLNEHSSVMLTVDHISNATLCDSNPGLTNVGVRYGYTF